MSKFLHTTFAALTHLADELRLTVSVLLMLKVKSPLIRHVGTQIPWCPRWNGKLHIFSNFNVTGQALGNNK
jgi:hypothetical protein